RPPPLCPYTTLFRSVFGVTVGYADGHDETGTAAHTRRLRLSLTIDRERAAPVLSLSEFGGMHGVAQVAIDPLHGLHNYQVFALRSEEHTSELQSREN